MWASNSVALVCLQQLGSCSISLQLAACTGQVLCHRWLAAARCLILQLVGKSALGPMLYNTCCAMLCCAMQCAEHVMLVDLGRNDVGKVRGAAACRY